MADARIVCGKQIDDLMYLTSSEIANYIGNAFAKFYAKSEEIYDARDYSLRYNHYYLILGSIYI